MRAGTRLAALEILKSSTICLNDIYFSAEVTTRTVVDAGMRAVAAMILVDFPTRFAETPEDYLRKGLELHDRSCDHALIHAASPPIPHAPYRCPTAPANVPTPWPTSWTCQYTSICTRPMTGEGGVQSLRDHGGRSLVRLERLSLLGPSLVAVHMDPIKASKIAAIAHVNAYVVHLPGVESETRCSP